MIQTKDDRTWAMIAHLSSFLGYVVAGCGGIIGPLLVWLIKKDESGFVADQAKESLNFQISLLIYIIGLVMSCFLIFGFFLLPFAVPFLAIIGFVLPIVAGIKANEGQFYRYPLSIRFIR